MINNVMNYAVNEANTIPEFDPIADGLAFMYESTCEFNSITNALNERSIASLQETGYVQPLNEQEKDGFFIKIGKLLKKFWDWVCSVWDKFVKWLKSLFTKGTGSKKDDKAASDGAKLYIEKKGSNLAIEDKAKTSWEYNGIFKVDVAINKVKDLGNGGSSDRKMLDNAGYVKLRKDVANAMITGYAITDAEDLGQVRDIFEKFQKGKKIDNIYDHYVNLFVNGNLTTASQPVKEATIAMEAQKKSFDAYVKQTNQSLTQMRTHMRDHNNEEKSLNYNDVVNSISKIQNYFTIAYSTQSAGCKALLTDLMHCKNHFKTIGLRKAPRDTGGPTGPTVKENAEFNGSDFFMNESEFNNETNSYVNDFLKDLSII